MSVIYMPSERCPKCPFNTLCMEETACPIVHDYPVNSKDMKREIQLYTKARSIRSMIPSDPNRTMQEV
jgi:hypothetical protein